MKNTQSSELSKMIGQEISDWRSSTGRAQLVSVKGSRVMVKEVPSPYNTLTPKTGLQTRGLHYAFMSVFGV